MRLEWIHPSLTRHSTRIRLKICTGYTVESIPMFRVFQCNVPIMATNQLPANSAGHPSLPHRLYKLLSWTSNKQSHISQIWGWSCVYVVVRFRSSSGARHVCRTSSRSSQAKQQARVPSRDYFSHDREESPSASPFSPSFIQMRTLAKSTLRVGSPNPHNTGPLQSLPPPLLDTAQQQDSAICGVNHTVRSLSRFKRYNTSNPAQVVTDGGGYFCMSITTIMRGDLNSYKRITTCKSCSYGDPHNLHYKL